MAPLPCLRRCLLHNFYNLIRVCRYIPIHEPSDKNLLLCFIVTLLMTAKVSAL